LAAQETLAARPNIRQLVQNCYPDGTGMTPAGEGVVELYGHLTPRDQNEFREMLQKDVIHYARVNGDKSAMRNSLRAIDEEEEGLLLHFIDDVMRHKVLNSYNVQDPKVRDYIISEATCGFGQPNGSIRLSGNAVRILINDYDMSRADAEALQALLTIPDERRDQQAIARFRQETPNVHANDLGLFYDYLLLTWEDRRIRLTTD
jgi:hypothetical protein